MTTNTFYSISNNFKNKLKERLKQSSLDGILKQPQELLSEISLDIPIFDDILKQFDKKYIGLNFEFTPNSKKLSVIYKQNKLKSEFNDCIRNVETSRSLGYFLRMNVCEAIIFTLNRFDHNWRFSDITDPLQESFLINTQKLGDSRIKSTCNAFINQTTEEDQYIYFGAKLIGFDGKDSFGNIAMVIYNKCPFTNEEMENLERSFDKLSYQCLEVLSIVKSSIIEESRELERTSHIKAAIAAIMARNMSHNLGSHVFFYVRDEIMKLAEKGNKNDPIVSVHKGLAKFLHYVQERQDFVATITSQDEYFMGPLNLKLDVLDELTPDAVDFRHKSEPPSTNFLLKYLANSEFIERKSLKGDSSNNNKEIEITLRSGENTFKSKNIEKALEFYNFNIAVQGGQQSRHAFLIIIENIIRNAAKHGFNREKSDLLEIQINIEVKNNEYIISISDNCENGITAAEKIKNQLGNLKILGADGTQPIDRENKGLKEIVVCIAWLKKIRLSEVFNDEKGICNDLLDVKNLNGNLCYEFTLPIFEIAESIDSKEIEELKLTTKSLRKYAYIFKCDALLYEKGVKYFPRCVKDIPDATPEIYWEHLARNRYGTDKNKFPVIIFERSVPNEKSNESEEIIEETQEVSDIKFLFAKDENGLSEQISKIGKRDYILFKNHLAKNDNSITTFYLKETEILGDHKPIITESISGANFSFNLFQLARIEKKQPELYFRIIEAYFTRIVIIDERLCPIETSVADELFQLTPETHKLFINKYISKNEKFYEECLVNILEQKLDYLTLKFQLEEWWNGVDASDKKQTDQIDSGKTKLRFNNEKNIYLYTIDKLGNLFDSVGGSHHSLGVINPHFLSIHISLLDKLSKFEEDPTATTNSKLNYVLKKMGVKENTYVAVHSGRGGLTDRTQEVTFIPFANLQWAFENSKYMLSELFHSQIYFPINKK